MFKAIADIASMLINSPSYILEALVVSFIGALIGWFIETYIRADSYTDGIDIKQIHLEDCTIVLNNGDKLTIKELQLEVRVSKDQE